MNRPYLQHSSQAIIELCKRSIYQKDTLLALKEEISFRRERFAKAPRELIDFAISLHDYLKSESERRQNQHPENLTLPEAYKVLGVPDEASIEEIASARRKLLQQYHPDKVASMAEKFRLVAESETKAINLAYSVIVKHRRFS